MGMTHLMKSSHSTMEKRMRHIALFVGSSATGAPRSGFRRSRVLEYLHRSMRSVREAVAACFRAVTPERVFWGIIILLLLLYAAVLILQPSAAGRGGR